MSAGYALLQRFVREASGISLDDDKRYLVENRLSPILREANLGGLDDLAHRLHRNRYSDLATAVTEVLTINETSFFRDRALFATVSERLLPDLAKARGAQRRLRIWCAGCSTGQEPYSLAMIIDDMARHFAGWQIDIVATDLSRHVIDVARRGVYSQFEIQRGLPVGMLLRHFSRIGEAWQISDVMRTKISFRVANLVAPPREMGTFDLIFCRNVLFYFDQETKRRVLARLSNCLVHDGHLVLGGAERVGPLSPDLHADTTSPFLFGRDCERPAARQAGAF